MGSQASKGEVVVEANAAAVGDAATVKTNGQVFIEQETPVYDVAPSPPVVFWWYYKASAFERHGG